MTECMCVCVCVVSGIDMIVCDQDRLWGRLLFFVSGFRDSGICLLSSLSRDMFYDFLLKCHSLRLDCKMSLHGELSV